MQAKKRLYRRKDIGVGANGSLQSGKYQSLQNKHQRGFREVVPIAVRNAGQRHRVKLLSGRKSQKNKP